MVTFTKAISKTEGKEMVMEYLLHLIERSLRDMNIMDFGKMIIEMVRMDNVSITMKDIILVIGSKIRNMVLENIFINIMKRGIQAIGDMILSMDEES